MTWVDPHLRCGLQPAESKRACRKDTDHRWVTLGPHLHDPQQEQRDRGTSTNYPRSGPSRDPRTTPI